MSTTKTLTAANDNRPATWAEAMALLSPDWLASLSPDERAEFAAVETAEADRIAVTSGMPVSPDGRYSLLLWSLVGRGCAPLASLHVNHTVAM